MSLIRLLNIQLNIVISLIARMINKHEHCRSILIIVIVVAQPAMAVALLHHYHHGRQHASSGFQWST